MEEDQELTMKHVCKFCNKSFPCGRSLGGHMRSHVTTNNNNNNNNLSSSEADEKEKLSTTNTTKPSSSEAATNTGYGLRENPKKTWRIIADSNSEDTLSLLCDKLCKECGKGFHSWKALFGHMKCHSAERERSSNNNNNNNNSLEDQDSWTNNNNHHQKLVMDSQSDNEATTAPRRRRRSSKRRTRRYMIPASSAAAATTSNSVSFAAYPSSSSLSEVEQEQEEVAMSLMMLSRDVGPWSGLHSVAESSANNSGYCFEVRSSSSVRTNLVTRIDSIEDKKKHAFNDSEVGFGRVIKQSDKKWRFGNSDSKGKSTDFFATHLPENGFRMNKTGFWINRLIKSEAALEEDSEIGHRKSRVNGTESGISKSVTTTNKYSSIKAKKFSDSHELKSNSKPSAEEFISNKNSHKRGKFECTTCNKIFHSYQALGGHRASHKKTKGCFASRNESSDNSIETEELSPDPKTTESSKLVKKKNTNNNSESEHMVVKSELGFGFDNEEDTHTPKKGKVLHECPICLKVFPSGQALGGHKRSHMANGGSSRNFQAIVVKEPVPEIRDLLDLNLPAATTEEESNSNADSNRPWWVVEGNNHKQVVGLMSN